MDRRPAVAPFVDGTIPTTLDRKLAPEGTHVFSMFTQWVPDDWNLEPHREELDAYASGSSTRTRSSRRTSATRSSTTR